MNWLLIVIPRPPRSSFDKPAIWFPFRQINLSPPFPPLPFICHYFAIFHKSFNLFSRHQYHHQVGRWSSMRWWLAVIAWLALSSCSIPVLSSLLEHSQSVVLYDALFVCIHQTTRVHHMHTASVLARTPLKVTSLPCPAPLAHFIWQAMPRCKCSASAAATTTEQNTVDCVAPPSRIWLFASVVAAVERYGERNRNLLQKRRTTDNTVHQRASKFAMAFQAFYDPFRAAKHHHPPPLIPAARHESRISAFSAVSGWTDDHL